MVWYENAQEGVQASSPRGVIFIFIFIARRVSLRNNKRECSGVPSHRSRRSRRVGCELLCVR